MSDRELDFLRKLPRERASEGFTEAILLRARDLAAAPGGSRTKARRRARWALAACALLLAVTSLATFWGHRTHVRAERRRAARAELARIRSEQRQVARQIRSLRRSAEPTIVYLGSDRDHDFVVDVGRLVEWARGSTAATAAGHGPSQSSGNNL